MAVISIIHTIIRPRIQSQCLLLSQQPLCHTFHRLRFPSPFITLHWPVSNANFESKLSPRKVDKNIKENCRSSMSSCFENVAVISGMLHYLNIENSSSQTKSVQSRFPWANIKQSVLSILWSTVSWQVDLYISPWTWMNTRLLQIISAHLL